MELAELQELKLHNRMLIQNKDMMVHKKCKFYQKNKLMKENNVMTMSYNLRRVNLKLYKEELHPRTQMNLYNTSCSDSKPPNNP